MRIFLGLFILVVANTAHAQSFSINFREYGLIAGYDNTFTVNVEGVLDDSVMVSTSQGIVKRTFANNYAFTIDSSISIELNIQVVKGDSIIRIGSLKKYVKPMPLPIVSSSGLIPGIVTDSAFFKTTKLVADLNIPGVVMCGVQPKIISYVVYISTAEKPNVCVQYANVGAFYNESFRTTFKYLVPGDRIVFGHIQAETAFGLKQLQPIEYVLSN